MKLMNKRWEEFNIIQYAHFACRHLFTPKVQKNWVKSQDIYKIIFSDGRYIDYLWPMRYLVGQSVSVTGRPGQKLWKTDFFPSLLLFLWLLLIIRISMLLLKVLNVFPLVECSIYNVTFNIYKHKISYMFLIIEANKMHYFSTLIW